MLNKCRNEPKDDLSRENNTCAKTIRKILMCQPPQAPRAARNDILNQGARRAIPVAKPSAQFFIAEFSDYNCDEETIVAFNSKSGMEVKKISEVLPYRFEF